MYMYYIHVPAAPLPTFILGPQSTEHAQFFEKLGPDGGELCDNITCLGTKCPHRHLHILRGQVDNPVYIHVHVHVQRMIMQMYNSCSLLGIQYLLKL